MIAVITKEWQFDAAQTDVALVTCSATERAIVTYAEATLANSATVDVACRLGFAAATLPTVTLNSLTGSTGVFFSHKGIPHGGGKSSAYNPTGLPAGAAGEDIRLQLTVPTGGFVCITLMYSVITIDPGV